VKAYSLWDLSAGWQFSEQTKLRVGMQNVFNTSPPYSNQAYYFLSGYDPSYTDPRGRRFFASVTYNLR
jgi:iron complex outermembrane receptor protein